jgi:hypothetical protein
MGKPDRGLRACIGFGDFTKPFLPFLKRQSARKMGVHHCSGRFAHCGQRA